MNKSFEKQRMSLKNNSRSLASSDSKRATKSISSMRNGKLGFANSSGAGSSTTAKHEDATEKIEEENLLALTMKQEPEDEDGYYEEKSLFQQSATSTNSRSTGTGSYPMLTRVRSHSRSLRAMANPSAVWAHFDLCSNDPLRAQCRICGAVVVRGGANPRQCGTTNLHRHLRVHHGGRLIGRRYQVMNDFEKQEQEHSHSTKALRLATQNLVRQMRNIAPAPLIQQQRQQRQQHQEQQEQRPAKTVVLKTIPLKVKQLASTNMKIPIRQSVQNVQGLPQAILSQQPTEVCLRWNSYHSNMQHSFPSLLDSEEFVDVTLACEGRSLKCHKMILSSCSDYLAQLLRENPCQHPIILMKDLKFWEVEALVKFMYRGEVNVAHDKLPQLLNAAEALQVKGLAGPSNSQNPKPPLLIPQTKNIVPHQIINRINNETKDNKPSTSINNTNTPALNLISAKRGQKRHSPSSQLPEARLFTKIRLQRPGTPQNQQQRSSSPNVKLEPLDIPLSPSEVIYHNDNLEEEEDSCSNSPNFENLIRLQEENDPGGKNIELADVSSDLGNNDDSRNNFTEEQMEFVPTDFLEQEQDIVEDPEDQTNCSIQFTDDDSKHNEEEEEEEEVEEEEEEEDEEDDEEEEDEIGNKRENESRSNCTKNDKT